MDDEHMVYELTADMAQHLEETVAPRRNTPVNTQSEQKREERTECEWVGLAAQHNHQGRHNDLKQIRDGRQTIEEATRGLDESNANVAAQ